jgi:peptidoglycan/xylan/chitin deacetylase (PgdA/CDA1 family)
MFVKAFPNSHGWITGQQLENIWRDQFDWVYRHHDYATFLCTIHPDSAGKPHVLMMLERMIDHMRRHDGVSFVTMEEMADDFARRCPFGKDIDPATLSA